MSSYLGDFRTAKTIRKMWNSNAVAGESITRATNGTISVYKDGGTTQSTAGVTDTEDFDTLTGVHLVAIDTSVDGTFYSAGSDFEVVLSAATIDGKTINATLFSFSLQNRSALMPTTDGRLLDVSAGGEAGVDWANVGSPTTTLNLSGTTVKTATDVETDTVDIQTRLPAALVSGRMSSDVVALSGDTVAADNAEAFFDGTGYAGTNNVIPLVTTTTTATNVTTVNGLAAGVITATAVATGAIDADAVAADAGVEIAAAVWDRVLSGATHNITNSAGRRLRQLDAVSIIDGTATAGSSNSITLQGTASATDDIYDENLIVITEGTGAGQTRVIVEYNGTTKVAIVNRVWQTNPDATSVYEILAGAQADIVQHGLAQGGGVNTITLSSAASTTDDIYIGSHIYISTSTGTGQTRLITDYVGATKVATVSPAWVTNPTSASVYKIIPVGRSIVDSMGTQAITDLLTTVMTESYATDGATASVAQLLYMMYSRIANASRSGTTLTAKQLNGLTSWGTFTLDSATAPASIERTG